MPRLKIIIGALFLGGLILQPLSHAQAAEVCDFGTKVDELKDAQEQSISGRQQDVLKELNIRKDILKITITCLKKDVQGLNETLTQIKTSSPEVKAFTDWIRRQIEANTSYYNYKGTQIDILGLKGAKDMAKELLDRRTQIDQPLNDLAISVLDWTNSQPLFEAGGKRMTDIKKTLGAFELPRNHEITLLEKEAEEIFNTATTKNKKAWEYLTTQRIEEGKTETKTSLETLGDAYTVLLKISEVSKKTLPL